MARFDAASRLQVGGEQTDGDAGRELVLHGIKPQLHPARYRLHKYWARKPHNVIRQHIDTFAPVGGLVFDPFAGSGVTVIESVLSGRRAVGVDVNPIASLIGRVTLQGASERDLHDVRDWIQGTARELTSALYRIACPTCPRQADIRMLVWARTAPCPLCETVHLLPDLEKVGRKYICSECGTSFQANQRDHLSTEVIVEHHLACATCGDRKVTGSPTGLDSLGAPSSLPAMSAVRNDRILATEGMTLTDVLGPRGAHALSLSLRGLSALQGRALDLGRVILTGALAQASRLLPYRSNLATGGPAWTVPGFWFPAHRVEPNFGRALLARYDRAVAALEDVRRNTGGRYPVVSTTQADAGLVDAVFATADSRSLSLESQCADYVFTDPPYGGSVPYLEFSVFWNAALGLTPVMDDEIIISDAPSRQKDVSRYERELGEAFQETHRIMKRGALMHVTFQHLDDRIWSILRDAVTRSGFAFRGEVHQPPSVVSSKAQLAPSTSPYGDMILAFVRL